jgi:glycosyltransferase involved in cell wall biosynthesis
MRVCIVTVASYMRLGGMQDHTCDLSAELVRLGHEVDVITGSRPDGVTQEERAGARWHFLDVVPKLSTRVRNPRWFATSADAFELLHARRPYDVVHSESTSALGLLRRGLHHRVPVVAKFHGNYLSLVRAALRRSARERTARTALRETKVLALLTARYVTPPSNIYAFRACEALVPSYQQVPDTARSHLLDLDRVHVVPNGIDTSTFRPQPRDEARSRVGLDGGPVLVSVGRLSREKGHDLAIRSLTCFGSDVPRLVLVGDGDQRESLDRLARELGVRDRISFVRRQDHAGVATYLAAADVVVLPTVREEAAPLVVPQAMAVGVPVVASSIGGVTEVIDQPGENGLLVPPGDVQALAHATEMLLSDPEGARRIGGGGRRRVLDEYTVETMAERTLAIYEIAAARLRPRAAT